jgi:hypothetical protein
VHDHADNEGLREMPEQPTEPNQQPACRNSEQNRINNRHAGMTNRTESTTDMSQQQTELNQQQTCRNNEQNRINNRDAGTTNKTVSTTDMPE